jgi:hypothetical protein
MAPHICPPPSGYTPFGRRVGNIPFDLYNEAAAMSDIPYTTALIVGAGPGISGSVARALAGAGVKVALAARNVAKFDALAADTGAGVFTVDAAAPGPWRSSFDHGWRTSEPGRVSSA